MVRMSNQRQEQQGRERTREASLLSKDNMNVEAFTFGPFPLANNFSVRDDCPPASPTHSRNLSPPVADVMHDILSATFVK